MRGWAVLNQPYSREQLAQARSFEHSLQIDPGLPKALVGLADVLAIEVNYRWTDAPANNLHRADDAIRRVLSAFLNDAMAYFVKGEIQRAKGRNVEVAVGDYGAAIALNPSLAPAYGALGGAKIRVGRSAEAFAPLQTAIKLSPRDPLLNTWYFYICHAHSHLGQYEAAIDWCRQSLAVKPFWIAYADLAASYAWTGRKAEAQAAIQELRRMRPDYTVGRWLEDGNGWSETLCSSLNFSASPKSCARQDCQSDQRLPILDQGGHEAREAKFRLGRRSAGMARNLVKPSALVRQDNLVSWRAHGPK